MSLSYVRVVSKRAGGTKPIHGETVIDISRTSILGNPFIMPNESMRSNVIDRYRMYLNAQRKAQTPVWQAIEVLAERVRNGEHIALQCWCAPLPCHGDVIASAIEWISEGYKNKDA